MTNTEHKKSGPEELRRIPRLAIGAVLVLLSLILVIFGVQFSSGSGAAPSSAPPTSPQIASTSPAPASTPRTSKAVATATLPPTSPPRELTIESANINVPVLPLTPTEADLAAQSLVPPETMDGYWLTNYGTPGKGSNDTVYITGHSWEDRDSPFNRLSSDVEVGDSVTLTTDGGEMHYVVDSITTHNKDTLKDAEIWNIVPNRLVLISCFTEDLWGKNVIVTARPAPQK